MVKVGRVGAPSMGRRGRSSESRRVRERFLGILEIAAASRGSVGGNDRLMGVSLGSDLCKWPAYGYFGVRFGDGPLQVPTSRHFSSSPRLISR